MCMKMKIWEDLNRVLAMRFLIFVISKTLISLEVEDFGFDSLCSSWQSLVHQVPRFIYCDATNVSAPRMITDYIQHFISSH